jgi:hypothetical protein
LGDGLRLSYNSRGGEKQATVRVEEDQAVELVPVEKAGGQLTEQERLFRAVWLGSKALSVGTAEAVVN